MKMLWGAIKYIWQRCSGRQQKSERGQYFAERVYIYHFPNGKQWLSLQVDDDNLPAGTLIAEYHFLFGQTIDLII
ncbi:MAG: hypothetical protein A2W25_15455 [candidate division Zixibacteria bacterium RBG_16_53_22]|nr:MAG: hypothetical protein A2W25_15455 [candidate division Zixibacteria bacterium RBG_16_53_22]